MKMQSEGFQDGTKRPRETDCDDDIRYGLGERPPQNPKKRGEQDFCDDRTDRD